LFDRSQFVASETAFVCPHKVVDHTGNEGCLSGFAFVHSSSATNPQWLVRTAQQAASSEQLLRVAQCRIPLKPDRTLHLAP
jgi:hypothetical protein